MRPRVGRLVVAALLFVGWVGYLAYLVATRPTLADGGSPGALGHFTPRRPLVLSRSQLLVSDLDVVARVEDPRQPVRVEEVLYPPGAEVVHAGESLRVSNLGECRPLPLPRRPEDPPPPPDWAGPGSYLLPLRRSPDAEGSYQVTPTPATVGYPPPGARSPVG